MRDEMKIEGKSRGGEGTTPVTTACPEALESRSVQEKKKKKKRIGSAPDGKFSGAKFPHVADIRVIKGRGRTCPGTA